MKTCFALLVMVAAIALSSVTALAQSPAQRERIEASFILALGRAPSAAEVDALAKQETLSISDLIARHRAQLQAEPGVERATLIKACADAFGRAPTESELKSWVGKNRTYTELMKQHIQWLAEHPAEYEQVMERAYQLVIGRSVYPGEIKYWKDRDTLSYVLLVGCIEDWGHRNSPGLMETTGIATVSVNCRFLTAIVLSPAVAAEARLAADLVVAGDASLVTASGRNLVAAGASNIVTGGRMHFVAAGSASMAAGQSRT